MRVRGRIGRLPAPPLLLGAFGVLGAVAVLQGPLLWSGRVPLRRDNLHIFYPLHDLMGKLLRAGELPVWSPYQMGGMPLLADPESGWGSVVAMLAYAFLDLDAATGLTMLLYEALAGLGMLLWVRATGVGAAGSALAALAYALAGPALGPETGTAYGNLSYLGTLAWLPWLLLGAHVSISREGRWRIAGWGVWGVASSQAIAVWAGQGAYYAFAAALVYIVYLALARAADRRLPPRALLGSLAGHLVALVTIATAISAWTLFPRMEFVLASNLAWGYGPGTQPFGQGAPLDIGLAVLRADVAYVGAAVIALALRAMLVRPDRTRRFYAGVCIVTFVLSLDLVARLVEGSRTLRGLLWLVPGIRDLHLHAPERILVVALCFGCALAGSALADVVRVERGGWGGRVFAALAAGASLAALLALAAGAPHHALVGAGLAAFALVVLLARTGRMPAPLALGLVVALTGAELVGAALLVQDGLRTYVGSAERYYGDPLTRASAELLRSRGGEDRTFGYEPADLAAGGPLGYRRYLWERGRLRGLLTTTQATVYRLEDLQGYNPVHLQVYDDVLATLNRERPANYRNAYLWPRALASPVLDMLNVRWVLTTPTTRITAPGFGAVARHKSTVLYENTEALPRAWVVHDAVTAPDDIQALRLIDRVAVDPRTAAVVRRAPASMAPAAGPESVVLREGATNRIALDVRLTAPGLVVLSELDYGAWKVEVDGQSRPTVRANGALRAVEVPAGRHSVVWRYASTPTTVGFVLSALGAAALLGLWIAAGRRHSDRVAEQR